MPVGNRYYNHMPHVKFAYNGRRPVSLNSHIFELKQAANAAANKAAANKAAANKAKALKKKNTPKPKNFKLSESLKKEAKKYRVKLMRQTWNYPAGSNKKNIVYVPKTRTQILKEIKEIKKMKTKMRTY